MSSLRTSVPDDGEARLRIREDGRPRPPEGREDYRPRAVAAAVFDRRIAIDAREIGLPRPSSGRLLFVLRALRQDARLGIRGGMEGLGGRDAGFGFRHDASVVPAGGRVRRRRPSWGVVVRVVGPSEHNIIIIDGGEGTTVGTRNILAQ